MSSPFFDRTASYVPYDPRRPDMDMRYYLPPPQELEAKADEYLLRASVLEYRNQQNAERNIAEDVVFSLKFTTLTLASSGLYWLTRHAREYQVDVETFKAFDKGSAAVYGIDITDTEQNEVWLDGQSIPFANSDPLDQELDPPKSTE